LELQNSRLLPRTRQRGGCSVQRALDCNRCIRSLDTSQITNFIPFDQLTNDEVVAWTKGAMGDKQVASIEASIQSQIDSLITPTSVTLTIGEPVPPQPEVEESPEPEAEE